MPGSPIRIGSLRLTYANLAKHVRIPALACVGGKMKVQTMELLLGMKRQMTARAMSEPAESDTGVG